MQWYTRYGSVAVDIVDMGIPCCRCIAEVSEGAESVDYGGAIHHGRETAPGGVNGALLRCHRLLRPCNVPACPSRDADDSQGRSFPPPLLCFVWILLFNPRALTPSPSLSLALYMFFSFCATLTFLSLSRRSTTVFVSFLSPSPSHPLPLSLFFLLILVSFSWSKRKNTTARQTLTSPCDFVQSPTRFLAPRFKTWHTPRSSSNLLLSGEYLARYSNERYTRQRRGG